MVKLTLKDIQTDKVLFEGDRKELVNYIKACFPIYNIGNKTTYEKLAYVIAPRLRLYRNGKEIRY